MSDPKDYLRKMIDHTIAGDTDSAQQAFKDYLVPKTMEIMGTEAPEVAPEPEAAAPEPEAAAPEPEAAAPEPEAAPEVAAEPETVDP